MRTLTNPFDGLVVNKLEPVGSGMSAPSSCGDVMPRRAKERRALAACWASTAKIREAIGRKGLPFRMGAPPVYAVVPMSATFCRRAESLARFSVRDSSPGALRPPVTANFGQIEVLKGAIGRSLKSHHQCHSFTYAEANCTAPMPTGARQQALPPDRGKGLVEVVEIAKQGYPVHGRAPEQV